MSFLVLEGCLDAGVVNAPIIYFICLDAVRPVVNFFAPTKPEGDTIPIINGQLHFADCCVRHLSMNILLTS